MKKRSTALKLAHPWEWPLIHQTDNGGRRCLCIYGGGQIRALATEILLGYLWYICPSDPGEKSEEEITSAGGSTWSSFSAGLMIWSTPQEKQPLFLNACCMYFLQLSSLHLMVFTSYWDLQTSFKKQSLKLRPWEYLLLSKKKKSCLLENLFAFTRAEHIA